MLELDWKQQQPEQTVEKFLVSAFHRHCNHETENPHSYRIMQIAISITEEVGFVSTVTAGKSPLVLGHHTCADITERHLSLH